MTFLIYPDAVTTAALGKPDRTPVRLATDEQMAAFVPIADVVGPDLAANDQPTTFIRLAFSGGTVPRNNQPRIDLKAHSPNPGPPAMVDPKLATSQSAAVSLVDSAGAAVAAAWFEPPFTDNVYALKVAIRRPGTTLSLKVTNTTGAERDLVWVAADNPAETRQPWLHASLGGSVPIDIALEARAGETRSAEPIRITNFGTGGLTVGGVSPPLAAHYSLSGLPVTLGPNPASPASVTLSFRAPDAADTFPATAVAFVTANKVDPGPFGAGHNNSLTVRARSLPGGPRFASSQEFSPKRGVPPDFEDSVCEVTLFGSGFDMADVEVFFGDVPAEISGKSDSVLTVGVPFMEPGMVPITVRTSLGSATTVDFFKVSPHPEILDLDPFVFGHHGDPPDGKEFMIRGSNFVLEPGDAVFAHAGFSNIGTIGEADGIITGGCPLEVLSTGPANILVRAGEAPDFFKFIGGDGQVTVRRSDGGAAVLEFPIKGL